MLIGTTAAAKPILYRWLIFRKPDSIDSDRECECEVKFFTREREDPTKKKKMKKKNTRKSCPSSCPTLDQATEDEDGDDDDDETPTTQFWSFSKHRSILNSSEPPCMHDRWVGEERQEKGDEREWERGSLEEGEIDGLEEERIRGSSPSHWGTLLLGLASSGAASRKGCLHPEREETLSCACPIHAPYYESTRPSDIDIDWLLGPGKG